MKNETQSALVARDAAIILLLIWAFMQALLMIWAPADTQTTYLLLLFLMDIAVLCGFMDRVNTGTALAATITCGWVAYKLYSFYAVGETVHLTDYFVTVRRCWDRARRRSSPAVCATSMLRTSCCAVRWMNRCWWTM